jgi:hypothetical protein
MIMVSGIHLFRLVAKPFLATLLLTSMLLISTKGGTQNLSDFIFESPNILF